MARKLKSLDEVRVDVFQAVKRAYMHRGVLPGKIRPADDKPKRILANLNKIESSTNKSKKKTGQDENQTSSEPAGPPEPQEVHEKLIDITEKAQDILFKADTVFPFTLFPDTITLDREKLTVATRSFFRTAKIISVPVSSILSAEADVGPFFGAVHMTSKFFVQNAYSVNFLWRADAIKIQRLLQGFIIAQDKDVDVTDIQKEDLLILLNDLGQGVSD